MPGQLLCLSADQLALMSSRQGKAQAQLELLQQLLQKQQVSRAVVAASCDAIGASKACTLFALDLCMSRAGGLQYQHFAQPRLLRKQLQAGKT